MPSHRTLYQKLCRWKTRRIFIILFLLVLFIYFCLLFTLLHEERTEASRFIDQNQSATPRTAKNYFNSVISGLLEDLTVHNSSLTADEVHWDLAKSWVNARHIHMQRVPQLGNILHAMAFSKIQRADVGYKGTQLKMTLQFKGGQIAVFKPKWYERDEIMVGTPYAGKDRHNGELASYHLGRLLKFNRSPLVVGRRVSLTKEILPVASDRLKKTFYKQDGKICTYGVCYYCTKEQPICGDTSKDSWLEGVVILWLPKPYQPKKVVSPWIRKYTSNTTNRWETDNSYCDEVVLKHDVYKHSNNPRLLDLIDTAVFDYLLRNADRHHYEVFKDIPNSTVLLLDNGKSFGNPDHDEFSILAPLYQCCRLRRHTYEWLNHFRPPAVKLSTALDTLLRTDPIYPVLTASHLNALDRRLSIVFNEVKRCIKRKGSSERVLVDDGFD